MKYVITTLLAIFFTTSLFAQQYANILQTPELIKRGYKGVVKKITCETYTTEIVMGKPVKKQLKSVDIDSFDKAGFVLSTRNTTDKRLCVYQYDQKKQLTGSIYYHENKIDSKRTTKLLSQNTYTSSTYFYNNAKKSFETKPHNNDTLIFNRNSRLESQHGIEGNDYYEYLNNDTTVISILDGNIIFSQVVIERDTFGNKLKETSIPNQTNEYTEPYLLVYKYEYYQ